MKQILFNTENVRALLEGRKTVTRRVVKPQPEGRPVPMTKDSCWPGYFAIQGTQKVVRLPYLPGDILWVRETWCESLGQAGKYFYRAYAGPRDEMKEYAHSFNRWRPSIHMPREAARIFLWVTNVQVERLQNINGLHAKEEGCEGYVHINPLYGCPETVHNFKVVWDSTIKPKDLPTYGWEANPWVWVIEFKRISKEEAYHGENLL